MNIKGNIPIASVINFKSYKTWYFIALLLLVASLPLSKFTMSLFQFGTLFFWLWHGVDTQFLYLKSSSKKSRAFQILFLGWQAIKEIFIALYFKFREFFSNKPAMVIASVLLMHVIGLLYTTDFQYAIKDLRTKLPIFILPLFLSTGPRLNKKQFYIILIAYCAAVVGGTFYQSILYIQASIFDKRAIWAHVSHIRFSLNAVFAFFILVYFVLTDYYKHKFLRLTFAFCAIWIAAFLIYLTYTTGIMLLGLLLILFCLFFIFRMHSKWLRYSILFILFAAISSVGLYFYTITKSIVSPPKVYFAQLESKSPNGNYYFHDTINFRIRNGNWEGLYICEKEMRQEWAKRSKLKLDSLDKNKQVLRHTLIRYLASKNLRKDSTGIQQLTPDDIANIESGINTADYKSRKKIKTQLEDFIAGLQNYKYRQNPNEGSLIQRYEYWRTAIQLIEKQPILGVGTGDIPNAFKQQYIDSNSKLSPHNRNRSHNQYLSITVTFGFIGLLWFLFALFYPGLIIKGFKNYFYIIYWIILILSMLTEDTIESQEGVTYFALLTSLLLLSRDEIGESILESNSTCTVDSNE